MKKVEVTWIKLKTNLFEHDKIRLIEVLPEADTLIIIWLKLLTAAGKSNTDGYILLNKGYQMSAEEMAIVFNRPLVSIKQALELFEKYSMIEIDEAGIRISNWEKHQNIDGLERIKKLNAERNRKYRQRKKEKLEASDESMTSHDASDREKEKEGEKIKKEEEQVDQYASVYPLIINYLNEKANTAFKSTSKATRSLIIARLDEGFTVDDFKLVIDKKTTSWLHDPNFSKFLRPTTLFGTKFEAYLNEGGKNYEKSYEVLSEEYTDGINF